MGQQQDTDWMSDSATHDKKKPFPAFSHLTPYISYSPLFLSPSICKDEEDSPTKRKWRALSSEKSLLNLKSGSLRTGYILWSTFRIVLLLYFRIGKSKGATSKKERNSFGSKSREIWQFNSCWIYKVLKLEMDCNSRVKIQSSPRLFVWRSLK